MVAIIGGGSMPIILRPATPAAGSARASEDADLVYRVVGEAYVHGIMDGEVVAETQNCGFLKACNQQLVISWTAAGIHRGHPCRPNPKALRCPFTVGFLMQHPPNAMSIHPPYFVQHRHTLHLLWEHNTHPASFKPEFRRLPG